jgi:hypothetical protein
MRSGASVMDWASDHWSRRPPAWGWEQKPGPKSSPAGGQYAHHEHPCKPTHVSFNGRIASGLGGVLEVIRAHRDRIEVFTGRPAGAPTHSVGNAYLG